MRRFWGAALFWLWSSAAFAGITCSLPINLQNGTTADATQVMSNFNTLSGCFGNVAASGVNNDITALAALATPINTVQGGTTTYFGAVPSTGSANAQIVANVTPTAFTLNFPNSVVFIAGFTNTGATQFNVAGSGLTNVFKYTAAGPVALIGGEIVAGNLIEASFDGTRWILLDPVTNLAPALPGAIGLSIVNDGGTPNTNIDVAADQAVMLNPIGNLAIYASAVSVVVNCTTVGANGLDAGSLAINTWYNVFLISNGVTTAGLASLSATAPAMPTGYTYLLRVGARRTDGSGNFLRQRQLGSRTQYVVTAATNTAALPYILSGTSGSVITPTWTAFAVAGFVPPTATEIDLAVTIPDFTAGGGNVVIAAPNNSYGSFSSSSNIPPCGLITNSASGALSAGGMIVCSFVLESTNIYVASNAVAGGVQSKGWKDKVNAN